MTDERPPHQFQTRPRLIDAADFARLCEMAWRRDPLRSTLKQIAEARGIAEFTVERWFKGKSTPPPEVVAEALALADKRAAEDADLLDRVAQALQDKTPAS